MALESSGPVNIIVVAKVNHSLPLHAVAEFMWDLALLHDRLLLAGLRGPDATKSPWFFTRGARSDVPSALQLRVSRFSHLSPLWLELEVAAKVSMFGVGLATALFYFLNLVRDYQLKGQQLKKGKLDLEKLKADMVKGELRPDASASFNSSAQEYFLKQLANDIARLANRKDILLWRIEVNESLDEPGSDSATDKK
jgi:hypothetical protein